MGMYGHFKVLETKNYILKDFNLRIRDNYDKKIMIIIPCLYVSVYYYQQSQTNMSILIHQVAQ